MKLLKSMYGTRQAASNWEYFYAEVLKDAGFVQGVSNPCLYSSTQNAGSEYGYTETIS